MPWVDVHPCQPVKSDPEAGLGISLTVVEVSPTEGTFSVHVIPHTWSQTALAALAAGARVDLETDMIGKYVRTMTAAAAAAPQVTWDKLRDAGFGV